jgi:hypothetical protein
MKHLINRIDEPAFAAGADPSGFLLLKLFH